MTYIEALKYLREVEQSGATPSHENSVLLMTYLDNLQNDLPVIHVAGTNGKGSTISFIRNILLAEGYSVGTFMSPHIFDFLELIEDNNGPISEDDFAFATAIVQVAYEKKCLMTV